MATTPPSKRPRGRPRKPPSAKPEQFSIRLAPDLKFGLELLARDRGISLSQAAEYAIAVVLRGYDLDGQPALTIATRATAIDSNPESLQLEQRQPWASSLSEQERAEYVQFFVETGAWKLHWMPSRLLTAEEKFRQDVLKKAGWQAAFGARKDFENVVRKGFRTGLTASDVAKGIRKTGAEKGRVT